MVCLALGWNPQKSYILLLLIQVASCGLSCIRLNPKNSYILLLLIQVACCGLFCIRLQSPEQLHVVASYSSGMLWFALHQVEIPRTVTFCCFLFKWRVLVCFALGWNPRNSYILLLLFQVACCGFSCIRLNSPEQLRFVASYSSGVLWFVLH